MLCELCKRPSCRRLCDACAEMIVRVAAADARIAALRVVEPLTHVLSASPETRAAIAQWNGV